MLVNIPCLHRIILSYLTVLLMVMTGFNAYGQSNSYGGESVQSEKVQVGRADEFLEITEIEIEVSSFEQWQEYIDTAQYDSIHSAIDVTQIFLQTQPDLSFEQTFNINLSLAEMFLASQQLPASEAVLQKIKQWLNSNNTSLTPIQSLQMTKLQSDVHNQKEQWFDAVASYKKVFELAEPLQQPQIQIESGMQLAQIFIQVLDKKQAMIWQNKALQLVDESQDLALVFEVKTSVASQLLEMRELEGAENNVLSALDKAKELKLTSVEVSLRKQLSDIFLAGKQFDEARKELEQGYILASQLRSIDQQYSVLTGLILLELAEKNPSAARKILNQANKLTKYINDPQLKINFVTAKASVLAAQGFYSDALEQLNRLQKLHAQTSNNADSRLLLAKKAKWQAKLGQSRLALNHFEQYHQLEYTTLTEQAKQRFLFFKQTSSQLIAQNQNTIQHLNDENAELNFQLSRNFIIFVLLGLAALVYGFYYIKQQQSDRIQLMNYDLISGAKNHNYLARRFRQFVHYKVSFSLVMFDIDDFTGINNKLGHDNADMLFRQIVQRLSIRLSADKELIRLHGDKFIVIVKNFDHKQAFMLAEILRKELNSQSYNVEGQVVQLTASFSAIECKQGDTLESLKQALTLGVQIAKQAGGDQTAKVSDE